MQERERKRKEKHGALPDSFPFLFPSHPFPTLPNTSQHFPTVPNTSQHRGRVFGKRCLFPCSFACGVSCLRALCCCWYPGAVSVPIEVRCNPRLALLKNAPRAAFVSAVTSVEDKVRVGKRRCKEETKRTQSYGIVL